MGSIQSKLSAKEVTKFTTITRVEPAVYSSRIALTGFLRIARRAGK
jgi:hypothetical protein